MRGKDWDGGKSPSSFRAGDFAAADLRGDDGLGRAIVAVKVADLFWRLGYPVAFARARTRAKQLVQWTTRGAIPALGAEVSADDKVVGRLTSVAVTGDETAVAIGIARRSHFDAGSTATGEGFEATVS